ncbi:hypothetical protein [Streptomyces sp. NPDC047968]|uniref:Lsr2 family DNA-binding protein n=1 Tax=unclassified Streptomyces TaxID=2593676 RepID=UPI003436D25B
MTVAALRALLDAELPHVPRGPAPWIPHTTEKRTLMTQPPAPDGPPPAATWTVGKLLAWADSHPTRAVRSRAARAREHIEALRAQHAADQQADQLATEEADLARRLADVRARRAELKRPTARRAPSYSATKVRAWAAERGITVPAAGRVPGAVVEQWRAAQDGA